MIAVVLAVIYLSCGAFLYRLFFTEPEIIAMGVEIMRVIVVVVLLQIAQVIYMGLPAGRGRCDLHHHRFHHQRNNCKAHCQLSALLYRRAGNYRYLVRRLRRSAGAIYLDEPAV